MFKMSWSVATATALLFVVGVSCSPIDVPEPATDLLPPYEDDGPTLATDLLPPKDDGPTLATDLMPPPLPENDDQFGKNKHGATLFLINVFAVKNSSAEDSNDVLHDDVLAEVPEETGEPLAMFLLIVEDEDEEHPVSLDEVAKDLEEEGFKIEKVGKDGETRLIKVDIGSIETMVKVPSSEEADDKSNAIERIVEAAKERMSEESNSDSEQSSGKLEKVRNKRHLLEKLREKHFGGGGGGCGGGCGGGGGGYYQPAVVQPVIIVPVQGGGGRGHHGGGGGGYYPRPQPVYPQPQPQPYYPPQQTCNTCSGGGGYGGGGSYSQASAQASASAQSYGR